MIREATDATFVETRLLSSLEHLDSLHIRAWFNEEAKFGFLQMAVTKISPLCTFAMCRGVETYAQLTRAVKDYVSGTRAFHGATFIEASYSTQGNDDAKDLKLMVHLDARVVKYGCEDR